MKLLLILIAPLLSAQLKVLPPESTLSTSESRQQLLAEGAAGGFHEDLTGKAQWTSSNPGIAAVDAAGIVKPVADGEATITASVNGQTAAAKVVVRNAKQPFHWSFRNHVIPVMTKTGCNQGACHGALAGKNGFKLTLRGYDPEVDYDTLTRQSWGRRVSLADPAGSLLLQKPSFGIPHGGGLRFKKDSLEYRVIAEWIAAGTPPPSDKDSEVVGLESFPRTATLKPNQEQQLVVRARYSDGRVEDVTRWVKFSSNNEGVALVDDNGKVKMTGHGEVAVSLWYSSRIIYSRLTAPFPNQVSDADYKRLPRNNYIDDLVLAKLKSLNLAPSAPAADSTFIRRAYLDAAGVLPNAEEVEQFLTDQSANKRQKLIDGLLEREEYVDYWAYKWSDLMLVSSRRLRTNAMWAFYNWIRDSVKVNKPWDQFARDIFTASGSTRQNGALNYFFLHKDPIDLSENVTQAFLGQRLTCARCHNHPLEKWTQKQYYQFANLFSRVGIKNGAEAGDVVVFAKTAGDINHPRLLRPLAPTPLDGESLSLDATADRRVHFAKWLTSPKNPYFARAVVNRVWANFMGRGLVDPVDDTREANAASNEELYSALTKDFIAHNFDIKYLIRTIMNSGAYQLASEANATNQYDNMYYSKYIVKRLPGEVILDAMSQVTGVPTPFADYPAGIRALQLPDVQVKSQFLSVFGRPNRVLCDSSERSSDPSIGQALHVINGDTLNKKLSAADGNINSFMKLGLSDSRILDHIYLSAYSRYPTDSERQAEMAALSKSRQAKGSAEAQKEARRQTLEDMLWALLTSKEFLFNY
ncbi:MAG TPA: DUF1549 domain-containing protein [Bryobacteraceae bacterium]|nr:DUF1549 domain-containing protein [Bryobacteraceae bacterium]